MLTKLSRLHVYYNNWLCDTRDVPALYATLNPDGEPYLPPDGPVLPLPRLPGYHSAKKAFKFRDVYKEHFNSPHGAVPWQIRAVNPDI